MADTPQLDPYGQDYQDKLFEQLSPQVESAVRTAFPHTRGAQFGAMGAILARRLANLRTEISLHVADQRAALAERQRQEGVSEAQRVSENQRKVAETTRQENVTQTNKWRDESVARMNADEKNRQNQALQRLAFEMKMGKVSRSSLTDTLGYTPEQADQLLGKMNSPTTSDAAYAEVQRKWEQNKQPTAGPPTPSDLNKPSYGPPTPSDLSGTTYGPSGTQAAKERIYANNMDRWKQNGDLNVPSGFQDYGGTPGLMPQTFSEPRPSSNPNSAPSYGEGGQPSARTSGFLTSVPAPYKSNPDYGSGNNDPTRSAADPGYGYVGTINPGTFTNEPQKTADWFKNLGRSFSWNVPWS